MINNNVHFSSLRLDWRTPQATFDELDKEFNFNYDPCADSKHSLTRSFDIGEHGLYKNWDYKAVFMNPPYGREIGKWLKKAYEQSQMLGGPTVVCLIPSRTDTKWWHDYVMKGEIRFIRGRLHFDDHKNAAPFPSAIVIFRGA